MDGSSLGWVGARDGSQGGLLQARSPYSSTYCITQERLRRAYLNDKNTRTIIPDPERFHLIRRLFELAMTGGYSLRALREETIHWGLRTVQHRRIGGSYLTISGIHRLLTNPFYAGMLIWNNQCHRGAQEPIINMEEYERVQRMLRRPGKPAPQKRDFPLTGIIRCGECGFMVTAETKVNRYLDGHQSVYPG